MAALLHRLSMMATPLAVNLFGDALRDWLAQTGQVPRRNDWSGERADEEGDHAEDEVHGQREQARANEGELGHRRSLPRFTHLDRGNRR